MSRDSTRSGRRTLADLIPNLQAVLGDSPDTKALVLSRNPVKASRVGSNLEIVPVEYVTVAEEGICAHSRSELLKKA